MKRLGYRGEERARSIKFLSHKSEDPSLIPKIHIKMSGVMVCACKPSAGETETEIWGSLVGQPCLLTECQVSERPFLKTRWMMTPTNYIRGWTRMCTYLHAYRNMHVRMHVPQTCVCVCTRKWAWRCNSAGACLACTKF